MSRCSYTGSCPFPNGKLTKMPVTTSYMADNYCNWNFTRCRIYRAAVDSRTENITNNGFHEECFGSDKIMSWLICGGIGW